MRSFIALAVLRFLDCVYTFRKHRKFRSLLSFSEFWEALELLSLLGVLEGLVPWECRAHMLLQEWCASVEHFEYKLREGCVALCEVPWHSMLL